MNIHWLKSIGYYKVGKIIELKFLWRSNYVKNASYNKQYLMKKNVNIIRIKNLTQ